MSEEQAFVLPRRLQTIAHGERLINERREITDGYSRALEWLEKPTDQEYQAYVARWLEWHRTNAEVLKRMFDSPRVADEYSAISIGTEPEYARYRDARIGVLEEFLHKARFALERIRDCLPLYPGPEDKPPALVTGVIDDQGEAGRRSARPRVFIASSTDGLDVAYALQARLEAHVEPAVWDQDVFEPSRYTLETLESALSNFDFAIFVFSPADTLIFKGEEQKAVRDNVIFELGLFIGHLTRHSCFIVQPLGGNLHLPSDLLALQTLRYDSRRQDENLAAAVSTAATRIRQVITRAFSNKGSYIGSNEYSQNP